MANKKKSYCNEQLIQHIKLQKHIENCKPKLYHTCQPLHHSALIDSDVFPYKLKQNLTREKISS